MLKKVVLIALVMFCIAPATADAGVYNWEVGCFNAVSRCWATNFDPNAGSLGSASRIDNFDQLPTLNLNNVRYGSGELNNCTNYPLGYPVTGGDYPWGGGNATCAGCPTDPPYPPDTACNISPTDFTTENYRDANGGWHFAMGGGGKCRSNGYSVPCNLMHRMYPYDCLVAGYSPNCNSTSPQAMPFTWGFPANMKFEMRTGLLVGGVNGAFHGFLCAFLTNSVSGAELEICEEPWNTGSPTYYMSTKIVCNGGKFATLWEGAGTHSRYMDSTGTRTNVVGQWLYPSWTMTRGQFFNLITDIAKPAASGGCNIPADFAADNWKLHHSENGMESMGPGGWSAGMSWMVKDETMRTIY